RKKNEEICKKRDIVPEFGRLRMPHALAIEKQKWPNVVCSESSGKAGETCQDRWQIERERVGGERAGGYLEKKELMKKSGRESIG
ncbi:hypothetical protein RFI_05505, partial [Reticulomyxa filosa]